MTHKSLGVRFLLLKSELSVFKQSRCLAQLVRNVNITAQQSLVSRMSSCFFQRRCIYSSYPPTYLSIERAEELKNSLRNGTLTPKGYNPVDDVIEKVIDCNGGGIARNTHYSPNNPQLVQTQQRFRTATDEVQFRPIVDDETFEQIFDAADSKSRNKSVTIDDEKEDFLGSFAANNETQDHEYRPRKNDVTITDDDVRNYSDDFGDSLIISPGEEEDLSWLVRDKNVPVLRSIPSYCRHLILTNFPTDSGPMFRKKVRDCVEQNLHASDYATLASSVYNYDDYLSTDTVSVLLQATPGGLSLIEPQTQKKHLRILVENIIEKFEPKYLIIFSPMVPQDLSEFIIDQDETRDKILEVIRIIKEFCETTETFSKTKLVHYSLNDAFSVNGVVCEKLFYQSSNCYEFNSYGFSMLGNILNIVTMSLFPEEIRNPGLKFVENFHQSRRGNRSFDDNRSQRLSFQNDFRRNSNRNNNRYQGSDDEFDIDQWSIDTSDKRGDRGYNPAHKRFSDRKQFMKDSPAKFSRYGSKGQYPSRDSDQSYNEIFMENYEADRRPRRSERNNEEAYTESFSRRGSHGDKGQIDAYHKDYKLAYKSHFGFKSGFAGKYKHGYSNDDKLRPRTPYKLDRDKDSYVLLDTDEE